jgi:hypothetical protein
LDIRAGHEVIEKVGHGRERVHTKWIAHALGFHLFFCANLAQMRLSCFGPHGLRKENAGGPLLAFLAKHQKLQ